MSDLTEYENFLILLYHAKIKVIGIQSGNDTILWDATIQRNIEALARFKEYEIEAHIIAIRNYFQEQIEYSEILNIIRISYTQQAEQSTWQDGFT